MRSPNVRTGEGYRPDLTPAHQVDLLTGISAGIGGLAFGFTSDFAREASDLEIAAKNWLIATGILAVATIVAALIPIFFPLGKDATNVQIVQYMTSKLVILAVFLTTTIWCGRIYKATKHQVATNSHRANALKTFQAFVKAASDDPTRNAVLLETTRSIFAIAPSGYLQTIDTLSDSGTKVLEIIKSATGNGH